MKVRDLMSFPVFTCQQQDSLATAAGLLWEKDCGILPVVDGNGRVAGTITDRDICMGAYSRGERLADLKVSGSMSRRIISCRADDDIAVAASRLAEHQLRRLPVIDEHGTPCGVISMNDFAIAAANDSRIGKEALRVLMASCKHRIEVPVVIPAASLATAEPRAKAVSVGS